MKKAFFLFLVFSTTGVLFLLLARQSFADTLEALAAALPRSTGSWSAQEPDRTYDAETIFEYIDGAGEVYRAYNMRRCLSRRYTAGEAPSIVLDIFDMGSSADAFGVFTHDRDGQPVDAGQEGLYRPGWLSFWKGRFFVSIYAERETEAAKEAMFALAGAADSVIGARGPKPQVLSKLPSRGLEDRSVRYFHHPMLLNYHYYLSDENLLSLGPETDALLASYRRKGERARLLIARYPGAEKAREACRRFLSHYLPEGGGKEAVRLESGRWSAAAVKGEFLAVVLEADSRSLAEDLLKETGSLP